MGELSQLRKWFPICQNYNYLVKHDIDAINYFKDFCMCNFVSNMRAYQLLNDCICIQIK